MFARHDDRWKELVSQQAPRNVAEESSNEEDPFGRRGAVDSDEDDPFGHRGEMDEVDVEHDPSGDQPIEIERPSEQHVNRLCWAGFDPKTERGSCEAPSSVVLAEHGERLRFDY